MRRELSTSCILKSFQHLPPTLKGVCFGPRRGNLIRWGPRPVLAQIRTMSLRNLSPKVSRFLFTPFLMRTWGIWEIILKPWARGGVNSEGLSGYA